MIHHEHSLEIGASPRAIWAILGWFMGQTLLILTAGRVLADNLGAFAAKLPSAAHPASRGVS